MILAIVGTVLFVVGASRVYQRLRKENMAVIDAAALALLASVVGFAVISIVFGLLLEITGGG